MNVRNAGVILHHDYDPTDNEVGAGLQGKTPGAAKAAYTRFIREHLKFIQTDERKRDAGLKSADKRWPGSSTPV